MLRQGYLIVEFLPEQRGYILLLITYLVNVVYILDNEGSHLIFILDGLSSNNDDVRFYSVVF